MYIFIDIYINEEEILTSKELQMTTTQLHSEVSIWLTKAG